MSSSLFSPLSIRSIHLKNRIVMSPMCQYSSENGFATNWHLTHLGSRAIGGTGLIITEATAVSPEGRISPDDLGIWNDEHIPKLREITDFIHQHGAVAGIQLAHAGRKASHSSPWKGGKVVSPEQGGWETVAPSAVAFSDTEPTPQALTEEGIQKVIYDFIAAANRALEAGFKVIEIHAAHGYLFHEFYSPLSNFRTDGYGGSFENRIKLLLQVVDAVREVIPEDYPLFVRISATDWMEGGWTIEDSVQLCTILKEHGVDLIDCSAGGNVPKAKIPVGPGYQVEFAESIKAKAGIMTGAVGMITTAREAEAIIKTDQADLVFIGRELLRDPHFAIHAAQELEAEIDWPNQYERAKPSKRS